MIRFAVVFTLMVGNLVSAAERPNVVFIVADDLGWSDTTLYGTTRLYQTPNIERLASRGMTFTQAYAVSPLCSPTRASLLTGLHPARHGITTPGCHAPEEHLKAWSLPSGPVPSKVTTCKSATRLDTRYRTLAEALKEAGYTTGHFGKWHLGPAPYSPLEQGFDVDIPHTPTAGPPGGYFGWSTDTMKPNKPREHIEDRMAAEACAFIEQHRDEPFFLNYWQFSVHSPFQAKGPLIQKYRKQIDPKNPQRSPTYAAMVETFDSAVGTILDTLDRLKLSERTVVVFTSDNGGNMYNKVDGTKPTSNAPLRGGKGTLWEGGVRVPCVVVWPEQTEAGSRSDALIDSCDFYPTLLDMLSLPLDEGQHVDGVSFTSALRGKPFERGPLFSYFPHALPVPDGLRPGITIHEGSWKLYRFFHNGENGAHQWRLYNLDEDQGERHDIAEQNPDRVAAMDARIEIFLHETHAVTPQPNPEYLPRKKRKSTLK
jgi:arylsulfatase A-like enzyme